MKKLMTIAIALFTTVAFAQEGKMEKKEAPKDVKAVHECYMMKEGVLMHHMGEKETAQKTNVTLKNGSVISTDGMMKSKDGHVTKVENGQCISMMGSVGDCDKMHGKPDKATMPDQVK